MLTDDTLNSGVMPPAVPSTTAAGVAAAMVSGTWYENTTGRTIFVAIRAAFSFTLTTDDATVQVDMGTDGSTVASTPAIMGGLNGAANQTIYGSCFIAVPPGWFYRATAATSGAGASVTGLVRTVWE